MCCCEWINVIAVYVCANIYVLCVHPDTAVVTIIEYTLLYNVRLMA